MNNQLLKQFYEFQGQREAVKEFMINCLKELAIEKTFNGHDTTGIKEARDTINKMFDKLEEDYGIIEITYPSNSR